MESGVSVIKKHMIYIKFHFCEDIFCEIGMKSFLLRVIVTDNNNISVIGLASSLNPAVMSASQSYLHLVLIAF